jgi:hypothetical protein
MADEKQLKSDEQVDPRVLHNKTILTWQAPEFIAHQRGKKWFLIAGIVVLLLVLYALYTNSATMAIAFIVLAGVYYLTHNQNPKIIDVRITELGISVADKFYPYNMINSYWIVYNPPYVHNLNLRLSNKTFSKVVVQLDVQDPVEVRKILAKELPEIEGESESMAEILIRLLRL